MEDLFQVKEFKFKIVIIQEIPGLPIFGFALFAARTFFFLFLVLIVVFVILFVIIIIVIVFIRASDFDDQVTTIIRTTITNAIRITTKRMLFAVWSMVAWLFLLVSSAFSRSLT